MLLKYSQAQKRLKSAGAGKPQRATGMMKITSGMINVTPRVHRKVLKAASKRPSSHHRSLTASKKEDRITVDPCDNSNDSGLGFDHHLEYQVAHQTSLRFSDKEACWSEESPETKRRRLEIKLESDDANDNFSFPESIAPSRTPLCLPITRTSRGKLLQTSALPLNLPTAPLTLSSQLSATSRNGRMHLQILCQPEQQHRARYQTEGSRGAVKDRTGNGFPVVKLVGYDQPTFLQVFIGTDQGRVAPHMFYQACRVSGKNSTPCVEKKVDGTIVIEVDVEPSKDMVVTCDCVGILKERNVDVEHRFPEEGSGRSKKKSTRCRMVFRSSITHLDGTVETLQVTSQPIVCTQPPGVPEICKKSLNSSVATGGQEIFILGKNFLKDTRVVFQEGDGNNIAWKQSVQPDKEFLQQSHLVCAVPPYQRTDITESVSVRLCVESSGKSSEPHTFLYTPVPSGSLVSSPDKTNNSALTPDGPLFNPASTLATSSPNVVNSLGNFIGDSNLVAAASSSLLLNTDPASTYIAPEQSPGQDEKVHPVMMWSTPIESLDKPMDIASQMMPPPPPALISLNLRRPSLQMIVPEISPDDMKKEMPDSSEIPQTFVSVSDLTSTQSPSMDTFRQFVSDKNNTPLPSLSVENFLSNLEGVSDFSTKEQIKTQMISDVPELLTQSVVKTVFEEPSANILSSVQSNISSSDIINTSPSLVFTSAVSEQTSSNGNQENINVINNNPMVSETTTSALHVHGLDLQHSSLISREQNARLDALVSSALVAPTSATERLDAFVTSTADSHISPNSSPSILTPIPETAHLNPIQPLTVADQSLNIINHQDTVPMTQILQETTLPSQIQENTQVITESSLCSLLTSSSPIQNIVSINHITPQPINLTQNSLSITSPSQYDEAKFVPKITVDLNSNQNIEIKPSNKFLMPLPTPNQTMEKKEPSQFLIPKQEVFEIKSTAPTSQPQVKKCEEGMPLPQELTNMSENDLLCYINTSYFDKI
uniref:Nuclear factor of activated T-cells 5 n=1 Tax=Clastoptera arizonana TaxID=38151 RepID=A0A1B6CLS4_9HEMI